MSKKDVWMISDNKCRMISPDFVIKEKLPVSIYNINLIPLTGWVLEPYAEKFTFDYKLYDLQNDFIDHVCKTYNNTTGNIGILLNGTKGTGKTVTAKELANKLNLPVIIVKSFGDMNQGLIEYLSSINSDCIFLFDEFEKNFNENDSTILQIMDGVYNSNNRKVFLLTTNTLTINDNLIGRPSRIRYVKTFGNLELKVVKEYLNDNLIDKSCFNEVIEFIDSLTISTIDILKSIVNEINIHGIEDFRRSKSFFNVKTTKYDYQVFCYSMDISTFVTDSKSSNPIYTMDNFIEGVKIRQKWENAKAYKYNMSPEEYEKICKEFDDLRYKNPFGHGLYYRTFESADKFSSLSEGSLTEWGIVLKVDFKNNVIITKDSDTGYDENPCINFMYFINPNTKPSLYSTYDIF